MSRFIDRLEVAMVVVSGIAYIILVPVFIVLMIVALIEAL